MLKKVLRDAIMGLVFLLFIVLMLSTSGIAWVKAESAKHKLEEEKQETPVPTPLWKSDWERPADPDLGFGYGRNSVLRI